MMSTFAKLFAVFSTPHTQSDSPMSASSQDRVEAAKLPTTSVSVEDRVELPSNADSASFEAQVKSALARLDARLAALEAAMDLATTGATPSPDDTGSGSLPLPTTKPKQVLGAGGVRLAGLDRQGFLAKYAVSTSADGAPPPEPYTTTLDSFLVSWVSGEVEEDPAAFEGGGGGDSVGPSLQ